MPVRGSFFHLTRLNTLSLQFFGILPLNGPPTTWKMRFSSFLTLLTFCCISGIIIPVFHFMVSADSDLQDRLDVFNEAAGVFGGQLRMIFVALNRKKIQRLYATCEALWLDANLSDFKIISVWTNRAKRLSSVLCLTTTSGVFLYLFSPLVKQMSRDSDGRTRSWPYRINMDPTLSPRYEIYYVVQFAAASVSVFSICGCDLIGPLISLHACGQLRLIQTWLLNTANKLKRHDQRNIDGDLEVHLKKCIRRHQIVMDLCAELEEVVCYVNLAQALGGMYMMAISAARLAEIQYTEMYKPLGPFSIAVSQLFLSFWPANHLLFESTKVVSALYGVPWYRCSPRIKKSIVFMMARSQRPARLTAGKFVTFSLETFTSIVSTAISVFMLLRNFDSTT